MASSQSHFPLPCLYVAKQTIWLCPWNHQELSSIQRRFRLFSQSTPLASIIYFTGSIKTALALVGSHIKFKELVFTYKALYHLAHHYVKNCLLNSPGIFSLGAAESHHHMRTEEENTTLLLIYGSLQMLIYCRNCLTYEINCDSELEDFLYASKF